MIDQDIVSYIRANVPRYGEAAVKEFLAKEGLSAADIEAAFAEAEEDDEPVGKPNIALYALVCGVLLLAGAVYLGLSGRSASDPKAVRENPEDGLGDIQVTTESPFRGHYGYILNLPPGYEAHRSFADAQKTLEVVHLCPKGTSPTNFLHEGLYGQLGILRIEATPRRVPQGTIDINAVKLWATEKLAREKSTYTSRSMAVSGMPAFIVNVEKPFKSVSAYIVGQEVRYTLLGGEENDTFTAVLSSLVEVSPHDRPGL
ncbi:MAG: hypothetical protein WC728_09940 [Elusimicrobiota bacterium]